MNGIAFQHGIDTLKILGVHQNTAISIKNYISKTILTKGIKIEDFSSSKCENNIFIYFLSKYSIWREEAMPFSRSLI